MTAAPQPRTRITFDVPPGACDCHTHIHLPQFPFYEGRVYTPGMASPEEMSALHAALHIQRVVIVQPSVYGTDHGATLLGMEARSQDARGVAVIDDKTPESELDRLHAAGMRGIRLNLSTAGINDPNVARQRLQHAIGRVEARGWHVQLNTRLPVVTAIKDLVLGSPVPIVFDHFAHADPDLPPEQTGFSDLVALVGSGRAYVKLSVSGGPRGSYSGFIPLARALIAANVERCVWGTNWPHPNSAVGRLKPMEVTPLHDVDDGLVLDQLPLWAPDAGVRRAILVTNAARLYDF